VLDGDGWEALLALRFSRDGLRTVLSERMHRGPLRVQRPFYPEGDAACHVYILHPPGGVVGGDRLAVDVDVDPGAHALLTTPAATKLYRSAGARSIIQQTLRGADRALVEWLPQETIVFSGAVADVRTRVELSGSARFIGWELSCLGRPAAGERFDRGELGQRFELVRDGTLVYSERAHYRGGAPVLAAPWGLRGEPVVGTLLCAGVDLGGELERLREILQQSVLAAAGGSMENAATSCAAISCIGDLLVARYLGPSTEQGRAIFSDLWHATRPLVLDQRATSPRIWAT
jgi:urease accessory protein